MAASSSSIGTPATNPRSIQMVKGTTAAVYSTETPTTLLRSPAVDSILYCAMNRPSAGSIWTNSTATTNARRPRNRNRLMARAARNANTSTATTVVPVIARLMRSAEPNEPPSSTARKLASVGLVGRNDGVAERRRASGVSADSTIQ